MSDEVRTLYGRRGHRRVTDIPQASPGVNRFYKRSDAQFIDHAGSPCSEGSNGWFFSNRAESWDEVYGVQLAETEYDAYIAFESPGYRPRAFPDEEATSMWKQGKRVRKV